jgi:hypothetical protein
MADELARRGFAHRYTEVPRTGHGCRRPDIGEEVLCWLLDQVKVEFPHHVGVVAHGLRHNRSYWVGLEQMVRYDQAGLVDATLRDDGKIVASTHNVQALSLGPVDDAEPHAVILNGTAAGTIAADGRATFARLDGDSWHVVDSLPGHGKRRRCSGPVGDLFYEPLVLVPGTAGSEEETFFNRWLCSNAQGFFRSRNGGVHRGGIMGENSVRLAEATDIELSDEMRVERNLLLYGAPASNAVLRRYEEQIPLALEGNALHVAGRTYQGDRIAICAVFPHPENASRYVAIHAGVTPDAIAWGSHLDMMLLPDYLIYDAGSLVDWGFWDSAWRLG